MVNLQKFYRNAKVSITTYSSPSADRIKQLFNQVITRLPDEEQFGITGTILIGPEEAIVNFYRNASSISNFGLDPDTNFLINDGNFRFWFTEDLEDASYLITLVVDNLDEKSDDYIKGLIAYKISEWSYAWKIAREVWHESGEWAEHVTILNQRTPPIRSEEYERNVDEEAERLGFAQELLVYDTQS